MLRFFLNSVILLFGITLYSCSSQEPAEFVEITDLEVVSYEGGTVKLSGSAVFNNPNKVRFRIKEAVVDIYIKDKLVAHIEPSKKIRIKPNKTFKIPIDADINLKKSGVLNNLLSLLGKKNIELHYKGYIVVSKFFFSKRIEIDDRQKLKF